MAFTDQNRNHLVNTYVTPNTTQNSIYQKTVDTEGKPQNAEHREKVDKVVTDTCNTMKAAWALLEAKYPLINCYGCGAHVLNLLIIKSKEFETLIANNEKVVMFIRNHTATNHLYQELMREVGVTKQLCKAVPTRWLSTHTSMQNTHDAKVLVQKMANEHRDVFENVSSARSKAKEVLKIIQSGSFWLKLATCVEKVKLPTLMIQKLEADNSSTEMIYGVFIALYEFYVQQKDKRAQALVLSRFEYISCDLIKAAHMLNHIQAMNMEYLVIDGVSDDIECLRALLDQAFKFGGISLQQKVATEVQKFHADMRNVKK